MWCTCVIYGRYSTYRWLIPKPRPQMISKPRPQMIPDPHRLHQKHQTCVPAVILWPPPPRPEPKPHMQPHINANILTKRAGVCLVATFHTAPPVWHLGEVFSDHLDHRTWFLLGSLYGSEVKTLARYHPESCMWGSALSSRSVLCVFSID